MRGCGGIGRRPGLKILWDVSRAGSTPATPTIYRRYFVNIFQNGGTMYTAIAVFLIFFAFPFILIFLVIKVPDLITDRETMVRNWKSVPSRHKQIIVTFSEFHKYYSINQDAYRFIGGDIYGVHPMRDNFVVQFQTFKEYKKFLKWFDNDYPFEKNREAEEEFAAVIQNDLDEIREKHIKWLEDRKREFEEQRKKLSSN